MKRAALTITAALLSTPATAADRRPQEAPAPAIYAAQPAPDPVASFLGGLISLPFVIAGGVLNGVAAVAIAPFQTPVQYCVYAEGALAPCPPATYEVQPFAAPPPLPEPAPAAPAPAPPAKHATVGPGYQYKDPFPSPAPLPDTREWKEPQ